MAQPQALAALATLLAEFVDPAIPHTRRREIETQLLGFRQACGLTTSKEILLNTDDPQILFFAVGNIEDTITWSWDSLGGADRTGLQEFLFAAAVTGQLRGHYAVHAKLLKCLARVAAHVWADEHTAFLGRVEGVLSAGPPHAAAAWDVLRCCLEELCSADETISDGQRQANQAALVHDVARMVAWFGAALSSRAAHQNALACFHELCASLPAATLTALGVGGLDTLAAFWRDDGSGSALQSIALLLRASTGAHRSLIADKVREILAAAVADGMVAALPDEVITGLGEAIRTYVSTVLVPGLTAGDERALQFAGDWYRFTVGQSDEEAFMAWVEEWVDLLPVLAERGLAAATQEAYRVLVEAMVARARESGDEEFVRQCAISASVIVDVYGASIAQMLAADVVAAVAQFTSLHTIVVDAAGLAQSRPRAVAQATAVSMVLGGALAGHYAANMETTAGDAIRVVQAVLELGQYCIQTDLCRAPSSEYPGALAEALGLLTGLSAWVRQLPTDDRTALIAAAAAVAAPLLTQSGLRAPLQRSAAGLLYAIAVSVRDPSLLQCDALGSLMAEPWDALQTAGADAEATATVLKAIMAAFCLPWAGVPDAQQAWETRAQHLQRSMAALMAEPQAPGNRYQELERRISVAKCVSGCIRVAADAPKSGKAVAFQAFSDYLGSVLALVSAQEPELLAEVLNLLVAVVEVLSTQVGTEYVGRALELVLGAVAGAKSLGRAVLEGFLRLATLVAEDRRAGRRQLILQMAQACTLQVWPALQRMTDATGAQCTFLDFATALLINQHKAIAADVPALLTVFAECLGSSDLDVFRVAAQHLATLDEKLRVFDPSIMPHAVCAAVVDRLLTAIVERTHTVAEDEAVRVLYCIAQRRGGELQDDLLVTYIMGTSLLTEQKSALLGMVALPQDAPSFRLRVLELARSIRFALRRTRL